MDKHDYSYMIPPARLGFLDFKLDPLHILLILLLLLPALPCLLKNVRHVCQLKMSGNNFKISDKVPTNVRQLWAKLSIPASRETNFRYTAILPVSPETKFRYTTILWKQTKNKTKGTKAARKCYYIEWNHRTAKSTFTEQNDGKHDPVAQQKKQR